MARFADFDFIQNGTCKRDAVSAEGGVLHGVVLYPASRAVFRITRRLNMTWICRDGDGEDQGEDQGEDEGEVRARVRVGMRACLIWRFRDIHTLRSPMICFRTHSWPAELLVAVAPYLVALVDHVFVVMPRDFAAGTVCPGIAARRSEVYACFKVA